MICEETAMKLYYPDYYTDFACIAGACQHSCCRGWEIDIDKESLKRYRTVGGKIGKDLRNAISRDGTPHFILREDERCPFLQDDGLCRMIIELGEESLCDICTEHPRFYNEYDGAMDAGLGACCEEAARLIVSGDAPTKYLVSIDGKETQELPLLLKREEIFEVLAGSGDLHERMERCMKLVNGTLPQFDLQQEAEFLLTLERMDDEWTALLESLRDGKEQVSMKPDAVKFERVAEYFVFRHFAAAETQEEAELRLQFAFLLTMLVGALGEDTQNILRLCSAEIEYSDENVEAILQHLAEQNQ